MYVLYFLAIKSATVSRVFITIWINIKLHWFYVEWNQAREQIWGKETTPSAREAKAKATESTHSKEEEWNY